MNTIIIIVVVALALFLLFRMMKLILRLVLVFLIAAVAYLTNPAPEKHQEAMHRKADQQDVRVSNKNIQVKDYKVFSLTNINEKKDTHCVGIGAFTKVWIFGQLKP
ncbi:MAG TPA: hypothetical protein VD816_01660 [Ohtaekwangia sp.]|nr:hypothetical protein [Ohtaekwangia sp.]